MRIVLINRNHNNQDIKFRSASSKGSRTSANSNKKTPKSQLNDFKTGIDEFINLTPDKLKEKSADTQEAIDDKIYNSEIVEENDTDGEVHVILEKMKTRDRNEEIRADNTLKMYFRQIKDYPVLSAEEEYKIAQKAYEENDEKAKQVLINSNLKFVISVAKKYMYRGLPLIDLIQEGNAGLVDSLKTFDYKKGVKFITYAVWRIESEIRKALAEKARTIEIPEYVRSLIYKIKKTTAELTAELGRAPTTSELSDKMGIPESKLESVLKTSKPIKSLDEPLDSDSDSRKFMDIISPDSGIASREILEDQEENAVYVRALLSQLSPKERGVLTLKYGIDKEFPIGIDEIARIYGISHDRALKIERRAMKKLKQIVIK